MSYLHRLFACASAAFFISGSALAQNAGTVTNHAFAIGAGDEGTGYTSLLCGSAQLAVGQAAADPICKTITGDVTITAAGVTAIGATKVTNAMLAAMAANTTKCNATAGSAVPTECTASTMRTNIGVVIGTNVQAWDADLDCIAANSTAGLMAYTGAGTCSYRTLTAPAAGFTITNPAGTAGNPTFVLANDLAALEGLASTGFATRTGTDAWAQRTLQAPAAGLAITNPAGIAGDPTFALANDLAAVEGLASTGIARRTGTDAWSVGTLVTNAELATMAAYTLKGNATGSSAVPTDVSIPALTQKASPVAADKIMIADSAASDALKYATVSSIASAGSVSSIAGNTGAFTLANGIDNSANQIQLTAARRTLPTIQKFTSGSGTYTTPANVLWIKVRMVGGGGGGGQSGTSGGTNGTAGGNSTFGTSLLVANGGAGGALTAGLANAVGGTASLGTGPIGTAVQGAPGGGNTNNTGFVGYPLGGSGGVSPFGGAGGSSPANSGGSAAIANTGSGGGGASGAAVGGMNSGQGGAAGGYVEAIITSPSATYSYAVGAAGTAGVAGASGFAGGAGGSGYIEVTEHYGS